MEDPRLIDALRAQGIQDERVLAAMAALSRAEFVEFNDRSNAWRDEPLPIGESQTISQPYVVARMTQALDVQPANGFSRSEPVLATKRQSSSNSEPASTRSSSARPWPNWRELD
jgi:protein-L-isoaspartate O-methyltransferase